jgi:hypothetical protein
MHKSIKTRRHSGRVTPRILVGMRKEEIIDECLEPQEFWDDWQDYRDGFRGSNDKKSMRSPFMISAKSLQVKRWNKKLKLLTERRKARKSVYK